MSIKFQVQKLKNRGKNESAIENSEPEQKDIADYTIIPVNTQ